jgi:hypothetical protein
MSCGFASKNGIIALGVHFLTLHLSSNPEGNKKYLAELIRRFPWSLSPDNYEM